MPNPEPPTDAGIPLQAPEDPGSGRPGGIFRESALENLKAPERLNDLVQVVPPLGWLSLWTVVALLAATLVWGFYGRIPKTVEGQGILLRGGEISSVPSSGPGVLKAILVKPGDKVRPGMVVATVDQPVLASQIRSSEARVQQLKARLAEVTAQSQTTLDSQLKYSDDQRTKIHAATKDYQQQLDSLDKVVKAQNDLLKQGLIPLTTLLQSQNQLNSTQLNLIASQGQLQQLETSDSTARATARQTVFQAQSSYDSEAADLEKLKVQQSQTASVVSPIGGTVVGVNVAIGGSVEQGTRILDLEEDGKDLTAILFFPAGAAKRIQNQMTAQISPETAPVERYGFIVSRVDSVADIPATKGSMMALLANEDLVSALTSKGPVLRVLAVLQKDPATLSGLRWSSSKGPPFAVPAGTLCKARTIVVEDRPIELVVPLLKKLFGIED